MAKTGQQSAGAGLARPALAIVGAYPRLRGLGLACTTLISVASSDSSTRITITARPAALWPRGNYRLNQHPSQVMSGQQRMFYAHSARSRCRPLFDIRKQARHQSHVLVPFPIVKELKSDPSRSWVSASWRWRSRCLAADDSRERPALASEAKRKGTCKRNRIDHWCI